MTSFFKRFISGRQMPGIRLIVFDFDGTLADTRELLTRIVRKHLARFNISMTKQLLVQFGNTPLSTYVSRTGLHADLVRSVCASIMEDFMAEYIRIKPCKNLQVLKDITIKKVIVSNNMTAFIQTTLHFLYANFFDGVYGADQFSDKTHMIRALCKKYAVRPEEVVYVGDKDIDVGVARAVGCYSIIISGPAAWSSRTDILKQHPDYVLTDLGKLPAVIWELDAQELAAV